MTLGGVTKSPSNIPMTNGQTDKGSSNDEGCFWMIIKGERCCPQNAVGTASTAVRD